MQYYFNKYCSKYAHLGQIVRRWGRQFSDFEIETLVN